MNLAQTRAHVAEVVTREVDGVTVTPRRPLASRPLDGWVVMRRLEPTGFTSTHLATLDVVVFLSSDDQEAEGRLDELSGRLIEVLGEDVDGTPQSVAPLSFIIDGLTMYALAATLLIEVEGS